MTSKLSRFILAGALGIAVALAGFLSMPETARADHFTGSTLECEANGKAGVFKCLLTVHLGDINSSNSMFAGQRITVDFIGNAEILGAAALGYSTCNLANPDQTDANSLTLTLREDCPDTAASPDDQKMYINLTLRATGAGGGGLTAAIDSSDAGNAPTWYASAGAFVVPAN